MSANKFKAGDSFPRLVLPTLEGQEIDLAMPRGNHDWQMVVVYRGRHCPLCTRYLNQLETLKSDFSRLGIDMVAVSADSLVQATDHNRELQVSFPVAYGLSIEQMQQLGLYISHPRSTRETDHIFAEPGLFVINDQGQVQVVDISNAPFARPEPDVLLSGLDFIRNPDNNYPIRGTYA